MPRMHTRSSTESELNCMSWINPWSVMCSAKGIHPAFNLINFLPHVRKMASKTPDELEKKQEPQVPNPSTGSAMVGLVDLGAAFLAVAIVHGGGFGNPMQVIFREFFETANYSDDQLPLYEQDASAATIFEHILRTNWMNFPDHLRQVDYENWRSSSKPAAQRFIKFLLGQLNSELRQFKSALPFVDTVWNHSFLEDHFQFKCTCVQESSVCYHIFCPWTQSSMSISVPLKMLSLTVLFVPLSSHFNPIKYPINLPAEACARELAIVVANIGAHPSSFWSASKLSVFTADVDGVVKPVGNEEVIANINPLPATIIVAATDKSLESLATIVRAETPNQGDVVFIARNDERITLKECLSLFRQPVFSKDDVRICRAIGHSETRGGCFSKKHDWEFPELLILHLKRFKHQTSVHEPIAKTDCFVEFPLMALDISPHFLVAETVKQPPPSLYDLYAVLNHNGNARDGHYTAYIKTSMHQGWQSFSDASEVPVPIGDEAVTTKDAYVLFYRRRHEPARVY